MQHQHTNGAPEIDPSEIEVFEVIGKGAFGTVYKGYCRGLEVAVKKLLKPITDAKTLNKFKEEVAIMNQFNHPNIVLFLGACTHQDNFSMVSEFLSGGDVQTVLRRDKEKKISMFTRMKMAREAALGITWLHSQNLIHRDLKTSNLLIDKVGTVKVCDFGLSQYKPKGKNLKDFESAKGTPLFMAPEVMKFESFNEKCDVYSFGLVLWELVTRVEPFGHHTDYQKFKHAITVLHERPPIPNDLDPLLSQLIQACWAHDPADRPSFDQINGALQEILVNVAVADLNGRQLWKIAFRNAEEVTWAEFLQQYLLFALDQADCYTAIEVDAVSTDPNIVMLKCMKKLLAQRKLYSVEGTPPQTIVSVETWGKILSWFGPLQNLTDEVPRTELLQNMVNILSQAWFHGDISAEKAEAALSGRDDHTFLIRFSSQMGVFTLSMMTPERKIKHKRIQHYFNGVNAYFVFNENEYPTLHHLVADNGFNRPCPGSKYAKIFQNGEVGGYDNEDDEMH